MGVPYDPPGFVGLIDAARILAFRMYPDHWRDVEIPPDEQKIWGQLRFQKYPSLIGSMLTIELTNRNPLCVVRYGDFIQGQQRLRDALSSGSLPVWYFDEGGVQHEVEAVWWRGTDAEEGIAQGTAWITVDQNQIALRYFVARLESVEALPVEAAEKPTANVEDENCGPGDRFKSRKGRPSAYPWEEAKQFVHELIEHHGLPSPDDPELPNQAAVQSRVSAFLLDRAGREPSASSVKTYVRRWLTELRRHRGQK